MKVFPAVLQLCTDHFHMYVEYLLDVHSMLLMKEQLSFGFPLALVEESSLSWHFIFKSQLSRMLKHMFKHMTPPFARKPVLYRAQGVNRLLPAGRELVKAGGQVGTHQPGHSPPAPRQDSRSGLRAQALMRVMAVAAAKYFAGE